MMIEGSRIQIRIRIHTSDYWIRIREAKKHVDPDSDPEHWKPARIMVPRDISLLFFL